MVTSNNNSKSVVIHTYNYTILRQCSQNILYNIYEVIKQSDWSVSTW